MPRRNQQHVIGPLPSRDPVSIPQFSRLSTPCRGVQWLSTRPLRVGGGECGVRFSYLALPPTPFASRPCHCPNSSYIASMRSPCCSPMTLRRSLSVGVRVPSSTVNGSVSSRKLRIFSWAAASRL